MAQENSCGDTSNLHHSLQKRPSRKPTPEDVALKTSWFFFLMVFLDGFGVVNSFLPRSTTTTPRLFFHPSQRQQAEIQGTATISSASSPSSSTLAASISWSGDSSNTIEVPLPGGSSLSLPEWLKSADSDFFVLGTKEARQRSGDNGLWDCPQPRIDFFGLDLIPVFVNKLEKKPNINSDNPSPSCVVQVSILDARTDIVNQNPANQVVASIMKKSKFLGKSTIRATSTPTKQQQSLSVDLKLTLQVDLPPFVLLPPGFNTVGSTVIARSGRSRTQKLLQDLEQAYLAWVAEKKQETK